MPSRSPTAHFLGIELATDQLRASVVDEQLDLVGVEAVDFDSELPDFQTHGGIFTTPGDAYTTPVELWIRALDLLLQKLSQNFDLAKIKSIGGSAQHACVWWKSSMFLRFGDPNRTIHDHLFSGGNPFSLPNTPVAQDTSTLPQALALEHALGGPDKMAARLGTPAHASLVAAHALRMRETQPEVWRRTGRITLASTLLCSLLLGGWAPTAESEACAMGMWNHQLRTWDDGVLEIVAGSSAFEHAGKLKMMLGDVDTCGGRKVGNISPFFVERYGFSPDTILTPFTSDYLSTYLSLCPSPTDAVLSFGPMDAVLTTAPHYLPNHLYTVFPHPAQEPNEKRRYIAMLMSRNGDVPRALVRDMYTKSWSAFDRLIAIVPPGGSIGLDDKLFSFWHLQAESFPCSHVKGIFRFETGVKTNEFRDLRANPRCLLESQLLSFRVRYARMRASNLFFPANRSNPNQQTLSTVGPNLSFDPYSPSPLPRRIIATGAAANFPSIVNLLGDVFNAPIFVPGTQYESAHAVAPAGPGNISGPVAQFAAAHRNAPAPGFSSRAALGGAYIARWVWGRERAAGSTGAAVAFEDEVRRLLARRWNATVGLRAKQGAGSGAHSPAPYLKHQRSAGLGAHVLLEEEEEDEDAYDSGAAASASDMPSLNVGYDSLASTPMPASTPPPRTRTVTGSSVATTSVLSVSPIVSVGSGSALTALTSPDGHSYGSGVSPTGAATPTDVNDGIGATLPGGVTPLTPVSVLPTADAEAQLGWLKVADPDVDAFMAYASIVPEFVRLESLLIKSLV